MAFRKSYTAVKEKYTPTTFKGKYSLKEQAGMRDVGDTCFVLPLDMANGYVEVPYHRIKLAADGTGFKGSRFAVNIACHKYGKEGEIVDQAPLCCRLSDAEKARVPKEKSIDRALTYSSSRIVIPVMVLSTSETDPNKKASLKTVSVRNGVSYSYLDLAPKIYESLIESVKSSMETDGLIDSADEISAEEMAEMTAKYLQNSMIKITNVKGNGDISYERTFRVIPLSNTQVAKDSGEAKLLAAVSFAVNHPTSEKARDLIGKHQVIADINNQVVDYLDLFNNEVDSIVVDYTDEELQEFYDLYLSKQGVVDAYKTPDAPAQQETVSFKQPAQTEVIDDFDFEEETAKNVAQTTATTTTTKAPAEEDFDYSTGDLESSPALEDDPFDDDDFAIADGDLL